MTPLLLAQLKHRKRTVVHTHNTSRKIFRTSWLLPKKYMRLTIPFCRIEFKANLAYTRTLRLLVRGLLSVLPLDRISFSSSLNHTESNAESRIISTTRAQRPYDIELSRQTLWDLVEVEWTFVQNITNDITHRLEWLKNFRSLINETYLRSGLWYDQHCFVID